MRYFSRFFLILMMIVVGIEVVYAQEHTENPSVQAVLFYSPTCPHCHDVIDHVLPGVADRFGDQLELIYVDVSQQGGATVFYDACNALQVPENRCGGVPAMVIGDAYLVGSVEIPARMETLVQAGLDSGGLDLSHLPLLWAAVEAQSRTSDGDAANTPSAGLTIAERFQSDLLGNITAVIVLLALIGVVGASLVAGWRTRAGVVPEWLTGNLLRATVAIALTGGILVLSGIILGGSGIPSILAVVIALFMLVAVTMLFLSWGADTAQTLKRWRSLIPIVSIAGIVTAGYLAYVEVGSTEAVCGIVGDCNAVQASAYASILGIPVGLLGVIGYGVMLFAWLIGTYGADQNARHANVALLFVVIVGAAFSIYLTFLEPFVIGAVCAWCITSALVMIALVGLVGPSGWLAVADILQAKPRAIKTYTTKQANSVGR